MCWGNEDNNEKIYNFEFYSQYNLNVYKFSSDAETACRIIYALTVHNLDKIFRIVVTGHGINVDTGEQYGVNYGSIFLRGLFGLKD